MWTQNQRHDKASQGCNLNSLFPQETVARGSYHLTLEPVKLITRAVNQRCQGEDDLRVRIVRISLVQEAKVSVAITIELGNVHVKIL